MKQLLPILLLVCFTFGVHAQTLTLPPSGDNQKCVVSQYIGSMVKVTVSYSSPDVTGPDGLDRTGKIWGTPVAHYGMVRQGFGLDQPAPWRAGANESTTIHFSHDVLIEGKPLAAGKYGLFLLLAENGPWTWIFSKNTSGWGSYYYSEKDDALRVEVMPTEHPHTEWLTYNFIDRKPTETTLALQWERKSVPMRISVPNMNDLYIAQLEREFQGSTSFTAANFTEAANFLLEQNYNLPKALEWIDRGMDPNNYFGRVDFQSMSTKAMILLKMDRSEDALAHIERSMNMAGVNAGQIHQTGRTLVGIGKKEEAMRVFEMNYEKFKGAWPTNVGMARGLSAVGKYDDAVKYAEAALAEAPDDINKASLTKMVEKLKARQDVN
jgi:tetratricopeptide (TPR) repeat protein